MTKKRTFASIVSGTAAALLVAGAAVFGAGSAVAYYDNVTGDSGFGSNETPTGGLALPGGGSSIAAGGLARARISAGANEAVTITVNLPGAAAPGITVAGSASVSTTTNADGNAFFNIRVPRTTPAGIGSVVGTNAAGAVIYFAEFQIAGRAAHPAAG